MRFFLCCFRDIFKNNKPDIPWLFDNGEKMEVEIIDIYDADTVTICMKFNEKNVKISCRLFGIDAAEIRTKNSQEKKIAIKGKQFLSDLIYGKKIHLECHKLGMYGRLLGTLYLTESDMNKGWEKSINKLLIDKNLAYEYNGKKARTKFEEWYKEK